MAIKGNVIEVGQPISGVGKTTGKQWTKQECAIRTVGQYPQEVAFSLMNDKITQHNLQVGDYIEVEVDARSRKYNDKWYTELVAWKVYKPNQTVQAVAPQQQMSTPPPVYQQQAPQGYTAPGPQFAPAPQNEINDLQF